MKTQQPQAGFAYSTGGGYNAVAGGYASPQPNYGAHTMAQPQAIPVAPPQDDKDAMHLATRQKNKCNDIVCLVLFAIVAGLLCLSAFAKGVPLVIKAADEEHGSVHIPKNTATMLKRIVGICCAVIVVAVLLTQGWIRLFIHFGTSLIHVSFYFSAAIHVIAGAVLIALVRNPVGYACGGVLILLGVVILAVKFCLRRRIEFAGENLSIASTVVKEHPATMLVALVVAVGALVWLVLSFFAIIGLIDLLFKKEFEEDDDYNYDNNGTSKSTPGFGFVVFLAGIAIMWGDQILRGILVVTVSGTVGTWWTVPSAQRSDPTWKSFKRATTTSLGSICFGALIIAIIKRIRQYARRRARGLCGAILVCLVACLENIIKYFTEYAYVYVGLYGESFIDSGKQVYALFTKSGFTTIINDFIVERVLMMNALIVALVSGGIGLLFGYFASHDMNHKDTEIMLISCGVTSVCLGFLIALLVLIILEAAVKSIYVCWAQAPEDFQQIHPDQFPRLYQAWMNLYPSLMESSGHVSQLQGAAVPAPESGEGYNDLKKPLRGY